MYNNTYIRTHMHILNTYAYINIITYTYIYRFM